MMIQRSRRRRLSGDETRNCSRKSWDGISVEASKADCDQFAPRIPAHSALFPVAIS